MPIFEDDKEIKIILKKFNLVEEQAESLATTFNYYFFSNYSFYFDDLIQEIIEEQRVAIEVAKEIAITAGILLLNKVKPEIRKDLENLLKEQKINIEQKQNELKEIELEILSPRDLSYINIDDRAEALDVFKNFIKEALISEFNENKEQLNEKIILLLFSEGVNFKNELEKALLANQQLIGSQNIEIDGKLVEPTVANWIKDFIKSGLIDKGLDFDKGAYFTKSNNFLMLKERDKQLITRLFDLYWQLKFFPNSLAKLPVEDWYIVPYHITEESKTKSYEKKFPPRGEKTTPVEQPPDANQQLIKIYYQTLDKYSTVNLEKNSLNAKTKGQSNLLISELIESLKDKKLMACLAVLELLAETNNLALLKTDPSLVLLFQNEKKLPPEIWQAEFGINYLKEFLAWLLTDQLGLSANDAAVFGLKLANILRRNGDSNYLQIAYGDSQQQAFKWF